MNPLNKIKAMAKICSMILASGCSGYGQNPIKEAVYLGVKDYGLESTNKDNKNDFLYRFETDGEEYVYRLSNGVMDSEGKYDYPLQNALKEGYRYCIAVKDGTVTGVSEIKESVRKYTPPVSGIPGKRTLSNFLKTALMPAGTALYIYGGGWDWQDEGSSIQARTLGVSSDWIRFFDEHGADYTYKNTDPKKSYYPFGGYNEYYFAGLDCSGYVGWAVYNTLQSQSGKEGYVLSSTKMAKSFSGDGLGEWTQSIKASGKSGYDLRPGDIVSISGHVWISLGTCDDGSIVVLHSTPSDSRSGKPGGGVQISAVGYGKSCEAYVLADRYMSQYYPDWYERYPVYLCDPGRYLTFEGEYAGRFRWYTDGTNGSLTDPEGISDKTPAEVLSILFNTP